MKRKIIIFLENFEFYYYSNKFKKLINIFRIN